MAKRKHGKTDYLFQRPGSRMWWIKLQAPGNRVEKSLGTPDRVQAEIIALPMVAAHKAALLAVRPRLTTSWRHELEPGREHPGTDGGRIIATDRELIHINHNGAIIKTVPNGGPAYQLVGGPLTVRSLAEAYLDADFEGDPGRRTKVSAKNGDDAILETYLSHAAITGYVEREAREVWSIFKMLTNGKPLKDCTRDDGRKLVAHFDAQGLKSATIGKKIAWPNAAVNLAIKEGRLTFNPFTAIVPRRDDKTVRLPLDDADMRTVKKHLDWLDGSDQVLFLLLACTGMRLSEAFEIDGEATERGARYVIVGRKTEQSKRRVPLPSAVLPYLPKKIVRPLFKSDNADPADAASKRLNKFLNAIGINDPRKVIHSLRHRAQDRLRAAGCPEDIRWSILGHERETVAAGYGEGFPVRLLKQWIDKIGF